MGVLIFIAVALLAGVLLLWIVAKLVVQLGLLAVAALAVVAIASFWLSAVVGAAAFFGIVQLFGESRVGWALAGGLLTWAVVWVVVIGGMSREISSAPQRWRRFVAGVEWGGRGGGGGDFPRLSFQAHGGGGVEMRGQCGAAADFHELSLQVQCGRKVA